MKKHLLLALMALMTLLPSLAYASQTTITATSITGNISGTPLASGYFCVVPENTQGIPTAIQGTGLALPKQACFPITSGAISGVSLPDTSTINPAGIGYQVQIQDANHNPLFNEPTLIYPTGATWSLDTWVPSVNALISSPSLAYGPVVPQTRCAAPALFYTATQNYQCVNQIWIQSVSGPGASVTFSGSTSTALSLNGIITNGDALVADALGNAIDAGNPPLLLIGGTVTGPITLPAMAPTGNQAASASWVLAQISAIPSGSGSTAPASTATPVNSLVGGTYSAAQTANFSDATTGSIVDECFVTSGSSCSPSAAATSYAITVSGTLCINATASASTSNHGA